MLPGENILPMDVIAEILARLPVKSILRFVCVCKSWNALISDPQFVKKQLRTSAADPTRHHVLVAHFSRPSRPPAVTLMDYSLPSLLLGIDSSITPTSSVLDLQQKNSFHWLVGSCHGMLCFGIRRSSPVLWNPWTRSLKNLPSLIWPDKSRLNCGFGYDHLSDSYKVVVVFIICEQGDHIKTDVMVHTLGTDSWRSLIQKFPADVILRGNGAGKFVSGTLNWLCIYNNNNNNNIPSSLGRLPSILSFDLGSETYQQLLLPDCIPADAVLCLKIDVFKGCLGILHEHTKSAVDVWLMKDYGNKQSWTKLLSFSCMNELHDDGVYLVPQALWISDEDDELLFLKDQLDLAVYNSKSGISKFHVIQNDGPINAAVYAESLISPTF